MQPTKFEIAINLKAARSPPVSYNDLDWKSNGLDPTCDISMNCGAFTNDSLTTMYEVVRGALDADDTLNPTCCRRCSSCLAFAS
jgi:hypothetical protein